MRRWLVLLLVALVACGSGRAAPDADPNAPDADPNAPDADPNAPDARPGGQPDAAPAIPACVFRCTTAADCDFGNPVNDSDNYACTDGACVYHGCNDTQECVDTYMSTAYACGNVGSLPFDTCLQKCTAPADCATTSAAYDADNYRCTGGLCEYTGCNSDPECATSFGSSYGCHAVAGLAYPVCQLRCSTAGDCVVASGGTLYDGDNYACDAGYCRWTGCNATSECTDSLMNSGYECR
jgi:hypothetical protein